MMDLKKIDRRFRILALVLLILILPLAFLSGDFRDIFYGFIYWIESLIAITPVIGALGFFVVSGLSAMVAFASSMVLVPSAILSFGSLISFFLLWLGWLGGSMVAYLIGNKLARPTLTLFVKEEKLLHYEQLVSQDTGFFAVLLFCLAVPSEIPGYVLGTLRYPFWRFLLAIALAEALYAGSMIFAANNFLQEDLLITALIIASIVVLASFALFSFRRYSFRRARENSSTPV